MASLSDIPATFGRGTELDEGLFVGAMDEPIEVELAGQAVRLTKAEVLHKSLPFADLRRLGLGLLPLDESPEDAPRRGASKYR
jgi:hypothetical protein